jgi:hypothetical protein
MAVAREQLTGHSEVSPPAVVARLQRAEEPLVVAEKTPVTLPTAVDAPADAPAEPTAVTTAEQVPDQIEMPIEVPGAEADQQPVDEQETVAEQQPAAVEEQAASDDGGGFQVRSEFSWTKLEFAPLEWQYDKAPQTIDIRDEADTAEPVAVDVRDQAVHTSRRRKARR